MAKNTYTRENIGVNDMLKRIIIRFDYTGVTSIDKWVETFKEKETCKRNFTAYTKQQKNTAQVRVSSFNDIETNGFIPVTGYSKEILHVFDGKLAEFSETINLQISSTSCSLDVHCNGDYKGAKPYLDLISAYMKDFLESDTYIKINRIGLRKIDAKIYSSKEEIVADFESNYFFGIPIRDMNIESKEYKDNYVDVAKKLKTNMSRIYRQIKSNSENMHQVIFDADSYIDLEIDNELDRKSEEIPTMLNNLNENLFEIFRDVVTEQFLSNHERR